MRTGPTKVSRYHTLKVRETGSNARTFKYTRKDERDRKAKEAEKHGFAVEVGTLLKEE